MVRYLSGLYDVVRVEGRAYSVYRKPQRERERETGMLGDKRRGGGGMAHVHKGRGEVDESQKAYRCAEGKTSPARLQRSFASFPMFYRDDLPGFLPNSRVQRLAARSRGKSGETLE